MVAVDVLEEVPVSYSNNQYLLVIQDYFTKWAEAIPRITAELVFSVSGVPDVLHLELREYHSQGDIGGLWRPLEFGKSHTTAYHPQGDGMVERLNRSLLQLLRLCVD